MGRQDPAHGGCRKVWFRCASRTSLPARLPTYLWKPNPPSERFRRRLLLSVWSSVCLVFLSVRDGYRGPSTEQTTQSGVENKLTLPQSTHNKTKRLSRKRLEHVCFFF